MKPGLISLLLVLLFCHVYSQDITNTLGPGGVFRIKYGTTTYFSLLQTGGNVGIGTATPDVKLQVSGGPIKGQGLLYAVPNYPSNSANAEFLTYQYSSTNWGGIGGYTDGSMWHRGNGHFFWSPGFSTSQPAMLIGSNGYIGIGTNTPNYNLSVNPISGDATVDIMAPTGSGDARLRLANYGQRNYEIFVDKSDNGKLKISKDDRVTDLLVIDGYNNAVEIDGALTGKLGAIGGAPFPRPAYNSGWVRLNTGQWITLQHNLGGNSDDYFVRGDYRSESGIHDMDGFDRNLDGTRQLGIHWGLMTNTEIQIGRGSEEGDVWKDIRIRIWIIK